MSKRTCSVNGCEQAPYVSGECRDHRPRCKIPGCEKPERARGVCGAHYEQWRTKPAGAIQPNDLITPPERFWPKVNKTETCWLWVGNINTKGYGMFGLNRGLVSAHRFAYVLLVGPIPEGLHIDHLCRVRHCVNPDHLEPVTPQENVRRGLHGVLRSQTHCVNGHERTVENTYIHLTRGNPVCRECSRADGRRYLERKRGRPDGAR